MATDQLCVLRQKLADVVSIDGRASIEPVLAADGRESSQIAEANGADSRREMKARPTTSHGRSDN
jgi:hypothetical protein